MSLGTASASPSTAPSRWSLLPRRRRTTRDGGCVQESLTAETPVCSFFMNFSIFFAREARSAAPSLVFASEAAAPPIEHWQRACPIVFLFLLSPVVGKRAAGRQLGYWFRLDLVSSERVPRTRSNNRGEMNGLPPSSWFQRRRRARARDRIGIHVRASTSQCRSPARASC